MKLSKRLFGKLFPFVGLVVLPLLMSICGCVDQPVEKTEVSEPLEEWVVPVPTAAELSNADPDLVSAIQSLSKAASSNADKLLFLAHTYQANDIKEEAIDAYQTYLKLSPENAKVHYLLGVCYEKAGQLPEAIEQWKLAIQFEPELQDAYWRAALASIESGLLKEAIATIQAAPNATPQSKLVLSQALIESGEYTRAKETLQQVSDVPVVQAPYLNYLLAVCERNEDEASTQPAIAPVPPVWLDSTLGVLDRFRIGTASLRLKAQQEFDRGNIEGALGSIKPIVEKGDANSLDWYLVAKCQSVSGAKQAAYHTIRKAIALEDESYEVRMFAGEHALAFMDKGKDLAIMNSRRHIERAIEISADRWEAYEALAQLSLLESDLPKAIGLLQKAVENSRVPNQSHERLIVCLIEAEQWEQAETFIESMPESVQSSFLMKIANARLAHGRGQAEQAKALLTEIKEQFGSSEIYKNEISALERLLEPSKSSETKVDD